MSLLYGNLYFWLGVVSAAIIHATVEHLSEECIAFLYWDDENKWVASVFGGILWPITAFVCAVILVFWYCRLFAYAQCKKIVEYVKDKLSEIFSE